MSNLQTCAVSFTDAEGIRHVAQVQAGSLYEAVARAVAAFRAASLLPVTIGLGVTFEVEVRTPAVVHSVGFHRLRDWLRANGKNPREQALKADLRKAVGL
ncbi:MAG: hypothetical protein SFV54_13715 [Bryobacteraceae bacterium]|nr:hypothetical protein [Bryobacteraceae bacterium]